MLQECLVLSCGWLGISVKILYCTLARPIFEYGVVDWNPHTSDGSI